MMSDLFDAKDRLSRLTAELREGGDELPSGLPDRGWHVPFLVNNYAGELGHQWRQLVGALGESGSVAAEHRDPETSQKLEVARARRFGLLFENLQEKYDTANRTRALLAELADGSRGFVLLLREFGLRTSYLASGSVGEASKMLSDLQRRRHYANALAPTPLLWVANPSESGAMESYVLAADQDDPSYRLQLQDDWERDVENLIGAAAYILVVNDEITPGVRREIELLARLDRIGDAFFASPESARQVLGEGSPELRPIDDPALAEIRAGAEGKRNPCEFLPLATSPWLSHEAREGLEREVNITYQILADFERRAGGGEKIHFSAFLDAHAFLLANLVLLELGEPLMGALDRTAYLFSMLTAEHLADSPGLARFYSRYADSLDEGSQSAPTAASIVEWNLHTFACLARERDTEPAPASSPVGDMDPMIDSEASERSLQRILAQMNQIQDVDERIAWIAQATNEKLIPAHQSLLFGLLGAGWFEKAMQADDGRLEHLQQSIEHYRRAIELDSGNFMNFWNRGFAFEILGHHRRALRDYSVTIRQNPSFYKAYLYRARVLEQIGKRGDALEDLRTAQRLEPEDSGVLEALTRFEAG